MATSVANAAALIADLTTKLGTAPTVMRITPPATPSYWTMATAAALSGLTAANIYAFAGTGSYKEDYTIP
jgi:hypothetical protein